MAKLVREDGSDDDGFDDFLSEDEEECALQTQEMAALARKMKTVGVREALDFGKETTLQEGFDRGFREAARDAFRFSVLRGALSVAHACALTSELDESQRGELEVCMEKLRVRSLRVPKVALTDVESLAVDDATPSAETVATVATPQSQQPQQTEEEEDTELLTAASAWLTRLGLNVPALA